MSKPAPYSESLAAQKRSVSPAQFAVLLVLASVAVLFVATVVAYWVTKSSLQELARADIHLPSGLWASTLTLFGVSGALEWALACIRRNRQQGLLRALWATGGFALLFLVLQAYNWHGVLQLNPDLHERALALFTFYMLTGVHAVHVLGGYGPLGYVLYRAYQREYSSSRYEGVRLCVQYWHFLGAAWLGLLLVMYLA